MIISLSVKNLFHNSLIEKLIWCDLEADSKLFSSVIHNAGVNLELQ